jgi:V8-like Glu-specific endopeptidase
MLFGCGLLWGTSAKAVIGGQNVEHSVTGVSSSVIALQMSETQTDGSIRYYKGTAVLVAPDLLLTAGHNVAYIPDSESIDAIFESAPCWGANVCHEKRIKAEKVIVHPQFAQIPGGTEFDLAVIKLSESAPAGFLPVNLIERPSEIGMQKVEVFGYGTDRESSDVPLSAFRLRSIRIPAVSPEYRWGTDQKVWLDQREGGICHGDSGGPAFIRDEGAPFVAGIAVHVTYSGGEAHCLTSGAFMDVLFFRSWIIEAASRLSTVAMGARGT